MHRTAQSACLTPLFSYWHSSSGAETIPFHSLQCTQQNVPPPPPPPPVLFFRGTMASRSLLALTDHVITLRSGSICSQVAAPLADWQASVLTFSPFPPARGGFCQDWKLPKLLCPGERLISTRAGMQLAWQRPRHLRAEEEKNTSHNSLRRRFYWEVRRQQKASNSFEGREGSGQFEAVFSRERVKKFSLGRRTLHSQWVGSIWVHEVDKRILVGIKGWPFRRGNLSFFFFQAKFLSCRVFRSMRDVRKEILYWIGEELASLASSEVTLTLPLKS